MNIRIGMTVGSGVMMLGVAWLLFWLILAFPLFRSDPRWGHNFALAIVFITVGVAHQFKSLSSQVVAAFSSFLTVPTFLALWAWNSATLAATALLILTVLFHFAGSISNIEIVKIPEGLREWLEIHLMNFAYIGLAHMPIIFFLVRWFNPEPFLNYLPVEHEYSTSIFNLMVLLMAVLGVAERFVERIGSIRVSTIGFMWTILMLLLPILSIGLLGS